MMSENKLMHTLQDIGLTDKEAAVYLAAVALGPSVISKIASASGVKRTTVYPIIESLKQKGLIHVDLAGWKMFFVAASPEKLEAILEQKRSEVRRALPDLMSLYNQHASGAFIRYYEGIENIKEVYEGLLEDVKRGEDYMVIGQIDHWRGQDPKFFNDFTDRRAKLPIRTRVLLQDSPEAREHQRFARNFNAEIKIMPPDFNVTANIVIIPRRVVINQLKPPYLAMVIENESIIKMNQEFFEVIWRATAE